MVNAAVQLRL